MFWTIVLKVSYLLGKFDSPSPGRTNVKSMLNLNHIAIAKLWSIEDYKVEWLFKLVKNKRSDHYLFGDPNMR